MDTSVEVLILSSGANISREKLVFDNAIINLSGDYLIVTKSDEESYTINKVFPLSRVDSYKIINNTAKN